MHAHAGVGSRVCICKSVTGYYTISCDYYMVGLYGINPYNSCQVLRRLITVFVTILKQRKTLITTIDIRPDIGRYCFRGLYCVTIEAWRRLINTEWATLARRVLDVVRTLLRVQATAATVQRASINHSEHQILSESIRTDVCIKVYTYYTTCFHINPIQSERCAQHILWTIISHVPNFVYVRRFGLHLDNRHGESWHNSHKLTTGSFFREQCQTNACLLLTRRLS